MEGPSLYLEGFPCVMHGTKFHPRQISVGHILTFLQSGPNQHLDLSTLGFSETIDHSHSGEYLF